jgi:hypothetical protein
MKRGDEMTASPALTAEASSCSIMPVAQDIHSSVLRQISGTDLPAIRVNGIDISLFPAVQQFSPGMLNPLQARRMSQLPFGSGKEDQRPDNDVANNPKGADRH